MGLAYLRLVRIEHGVLTSLIVLASYIIVGGRNSLAMTLLFLSSLLTEAFLFATNDIYNVEEDRVNRPDAPLVRGDASLRSAWVLSLVSVVLAVIFNVIGVVLGILMPLSLVILILAIMLGFAYNYGLKRTLLVNNTLVSITSSLTFLYGLYAVKVTLPTLDLPYLLFITSFLATMGREFIKGVLDVPGDIKVGVRTVANTHGVKVAVVMAVVFVLLAVAVSPLIILQALSEAFGIVLSVGVVITDALLMYISIMVLVRSNYAGRFRVIALGAMAVTIIAYLLSALVAVLT
nr:MAG: ubiquinone biosynthesis protein UbiA [Vulcanisaeta sp. AZ3]